MNTKHNGFKEGLAALVGKAQEKSTTPKAPDTTFSQFFDSMDNKELLSSLSDRYVYQAARR